jgi:hypothetical protein
MDCFSGRTMNKWILAKGGFGVNGQSATVPTLHSARENAIQRQRCNQEKTG